MSGGTLVVVVEAEAGAEAEDLAVREVVGVDDVLAELDVGSAAGAVSAEEASARLLDGSVSRLGEADAEPDDWTKAGADRSLWLTPAEQAANSSVTAGIIHLPDLPRPARL